MILNTEVQGCEMRCVYLLSEELRLDPNQMALTQALTLNQARPQMGLMELPPSGGRFVA
jgi:hypothetical protein